MHGTTVKIAANYLPRYSAFTSHKGEGLIHTAEETRKHAVTDLLS